ncbi:MAG: metallophosphoesterase family protein [Verrucomicrobia bacterium]|nr:metallophosphoesterase family protein [Verrucomicrobiota bacterium]
MLTRVFSDIHFGDPATKVRHLDQLQPLFDGADEVVLNGDTLDTRPGRRPEHTAACQAQLRAFAGSQRAAVTLLTGNHDPDLSSCHSRDLADGQIFATHGDVLFDNIVPWGRDAPLIARLIAAELGALAAHERQGFESRFAIWRRVAAQIPQRHQAEPRGPRYAAGFIADTVWPPLRIFRVLQSWRVEPHRAAAWVRRHRPAAKFVLLGHTHRPAIRRAGGVTVINTGTFCPPFGAFAVDLAPGRITVRRVAERAGAFHPGGIVAEFSLV